MAELPLLLSDLAVLGPAKSSLLLLNYALAMVNWKSPEVIANDELIFLKSVHVLLGVYCWELFISLNFDWQYVSGKRRFRWPMIFYFLNRYFLLFCIIGTTVALNVTTKINCQALYNFNQIMGCLSLGLSCINFAIRTMAVWAMRWYIVVPLVILIIGHLAIVMHGMYLKAGWDPQIGGCVITKSSATLDLAMYIYSMCFDFLLLCLTGYKLHTYISNTKFASLATLVFRDGLAYFIIAFLANSIAVILNLLNFNNVMAIIANGPAIVVSTIAVTRAVRRLANYSFDRADACHITLPQATSVSRGASGAVRDQGQGHGNATGHELETVAPDKPDDVKE